MYTGDGISKWREDSQSQNFKNVHVALLRHKKIILPIGPSYLRSRELYPCVRMMIVNSSKYSSFWADKAFLTIF
jgi:hypothetical protein